MKKRCLILFVLVFCSTPNSFQGTTYSSTLSDVFGQGLWNDMICGSRDQASITHMQGKYLFNALSLPSTYLF